MNNQLQVHCGPAARDGKRAVIATLGEKQHMDKFDVVSDFHRNRFRVTTINRFDLTEEAHKWLDELIIDAAAAEDERAAANGDGRWQPTLVRMADVAAKPIKWLWPDRFALGRLSLLVGMPGAGKSFLTCDMAARISTGTPWPDGSVCERGSVLLVTAEDDPGDTIRPRLDAHRADVDRVHLLAGLHREEADGSRAEEIYPLTDSAALEAALEKIADCRLIVIDPVGSFLGGQTDAHRENEVRAVLAPVAKVAEAYGTAVLVVMHRRKSAGAVADDTAMGSRAFTGIARSVWHLSTERENRGRRLFLPGKSNLTAVQTGLAFSIAGDPAAVQWERDPVAMTADDAMAQEQRDWGDPTAIDDAISWLTDALAGGPHSSKELRDEARVDGIAWRTVERAKGKLGVIAGPDGFGGPWVWKLPDSASVRQDSPQSAKYESLADSDETVADSGVTPLSDDDRVAAEAQWLADSF